MASNDAIASIKHVTGMVRNTRKGSLCEWSRTGREELRRLLHKGEISHAEHYRALILIDNAYANRIVDGLPSQFRHQLTTPMRVSA